MNKMVTLVGLFLLASSLRLPPPRPPRVRGHRLLHLGWPSSVSLPPPATMDVLGLCRSSAAVFPPSSPRASPWPWSSPTSTGLAFSTAARSPTALQACPPSGLPSSPSPLHPPSLFPNPFARVREEGGGQWRSQGAGRGHAPLTCVNKFCY